MNHVPVKVQVARELYGETAVKYGLNSNRRDGALMASTVDWRDSHTRAIETEQPLVQTANLDSTERKYQNLQSSIFGGGYIENEPIVCDRTHKKSTYTSIAEWTDSSTHSKANNQQKENDAFKIK